MSPDTPRSLALVLGASGDQGAPQVAALVRSGWRVRAASRGGNLIPQDALNVEAVRVDYRDPDSLESAMRGVRVLLVNYPSSSFNDGAALIAAAELTGRLAVRAGVELVVFNSSLPLPENSLGMPAQDVRFAQRAALRDCGLQVISLQPVVYMDNLLRGWAYPAIAERNCFEYPHRPDLEVSWLCLEDLATIAAAVAARPDLAGKDLAVGGPDALRGPQVAQILSEVCGRRISFSSLSIETFGERMAVRFARSGTLDARSLRYELERIYRWYNDSPSRPFRVEMDALRSDLGVRLTTLREWAFRQDWG